MTNGWVKVYRSFLNWEWYDDINTSRLFIHLLLKANHAPKKWRGITIETGQHLTSIRRLARETKLSVKAVRISIDKLKSTKEIMQEYVLKKSIITICNFSVFQENGVDRGTIRGTIQSTPSMVYPLIRGTIRGTVGAQYNDKKGHIKGHNKGHNTEHAQYGLPHNQGHIKGHIKGHTENEKKGTHNKNDINNKNKEHKEEYKEENFIIDKSMTIQKINIPFAEIVKLYQKHCGKILPSVSILTVDRKKHIRARWINNLTMLEDWDKYFKKVSDSDFLMGRGKSGWGRCSFDWLIKPSNVVKVLENQYSNYR